MGFENYKLGLLVRLVFLFASLALLSYLLIGPGYLVTSLVLSLIILLQIFSLLHYLDRTNIEVTRFLDALRYEDFSQTFSLEKLGGSYKGLGAAMEDISGRFRESRKDSEAQNRYLKAVVDHAPVPLVALHQTGRVDLLNHTARQLFDAANIRGSEGMARYGARFQRDIAQIRPGRHRLTKIRIDEVDQHLILSATQITIKGAQLKLIALQNIQQELDATELASWQEFSHVLTHEIMNSITPVASLAKTACNLVDRLADAPDDAENFQDVKDAVETLARRSEGLIHFVQAYRKLIQMPPPNRKELKLDVLFSRLKTLFEAEYAKAGIELIIEIEPKGLPLSADDSLLEQALINLLKNSADALSETDRPKIRLRAMRNARGKIAIEVADNGPGIPESKQDQIFIPFFTTKQDGSGIGLSLVRQIVLTHGGVISAGNAPEGGALFRLVF